VKKFYETNYSSNLMNLVLFVNSNIDKKELKKFINSKFGKITNNNVKPKRAFGKILDPGKILYCVPVSNEDKITLIFEMETLESNPIISPNIFLCQLIGHEGNNSLHKILSDKGYISNLYSGVETQLDDNSLLQITIELSEKGLAHKDEIIETIFEYIKNIRSVLNDNKLKIIYDEIRTLQKIHFNNWHDSDPIDVVQYVSSMLIRKYINPKYIFALGTLLGEYESILPNLNRVFSQLIKSNCSIVISSKIYENKLSMTEKHYGISYQLRNNISSGKSVIIENFIPEANKFISFQNKLIEQPDDKTPTLVRNNKINGYRYFNSSFGVSDTVIFAEFELPKLFNSRELWLGFILFINALYSDNNSMIYTAQMAGYEISLIVEHKSLIIKISGLTNKILKVLREVVNMLKNAILREIAFDSAKDIMKKNFINEQFIMPIGKASIIIKQHLLKNFFTTNELLKIIDSITLELSFESFKQVFELSNCTVLVSGNIKSGKVDDIYDIFEELYEKYVRIKYNATLFDRQDVKPVHEYTEIIQNNENLTEKNSASMYVIELCKYTSGITSDWEKLVLLTMFSEVYYSNKYFDALRTKEQLGYIVNTSKLMLGDPRIKNVYLSFNVQSPIKEPKYLFKRTKQFLEESRTGLLKMKDVEFEQYRNGLISQYSEPFHNLDELTTYFWGQIIEHVFMYNKKEILLNSLKKIKKDEVINMLEMHVIDNNKVIAGGVIKA
jgi:secreted Zn-dependent insulinase-like peptidase